jgi:hypothetical protein
VINTVRDLLNDPKLVDRLKEIRDGIANLERLNANLDTLWTEVKGKPGVSPEERRAWRTRSTRRWNCFDARISR